MLQSAAREEAVVSNAQAQQETSVPFVIDARWAKAAAVHFAQTTPTFRSRPKRFKCLPADLLCFQTPAGSLTTNSLYHSPAFVPSC